MVLFVPNSCCYLALKAKCFQQLLGKIVQRLDGFPLDFNYKCIRDPSRVLIQKEMSKVYHIGANWGHPERTSHLNPDFFTHYPRVLVIWILEIRLR